MLTRPRPPLADDRRPAGVPHDRRVDFQLDIPRFNRATPISRDAIPRPPQPAGAWRTSSISREVVVPPADAAVRPCYPLPFYICMATHARSLVSGSKHTSYPCDCEPKRLTCRGLERFKGRNVCAQDDAGCMVSFSYYPFAL